MFIIDNLTNKIKLIITFLILAVIIICDTYINGMKVSKFILGFLAGASAAPLVFTVYSLLRTNSVLILHSLIFNKDKNKKKNDINDDIDDAIDDAIDNGIVNMMSDINDAIDNNDNNNANDIDIDDAIDNTIDNTINNTIDDGISDTTSNKVYKSNLDDIDTGNYNKDLSDRLSPLISFIVMLPSLHLKFRMRLVLIRVSLIFMTIAGLFMCFNLVVLNQFNMMQLATIIILSCLNIIINLYQMFDSN